MNYKYLACTLLLALASTLTQAQVKIGNNPTTITPGALLDIEGSTTDTRTVSLPNGNFGIMTNSPILTLDVNGNAGIRNTNTLEFGLTLSNKAFDAGKIGYQYATPYALDIIGAGISNAPRFVKLWDNVLIGTNSYLEFGNGITNKAVDAGKIGYQLATPFALDIVGAGESNAPRHIKLWDKVKIGGTALPITPLDVEGQVRIADGTQGAGKILISDANGVARWGSSASQINFFTSFTGVRTFAANNYNTKIDFGFAAPNDGGGYDVNSDVFTAPVSGIYFFVGTTYVDSPNVGANGNASTYRDVLSIKVNGGARITQENFQYQQNSTNTIGNAFSVSYLVRLNAGDKVELFGASNKPNPEFVGYANSINAPQTTFTGFLIGQ